MRIIGCVFYPESQQIALVDQKTGKFGERRLQHRGKAEAYYRSLAARGAIAGVPTASSNRLLKGAFPDSRGTFSALTPPSGQRTR